jgi:O-antigen/teichoic acid export membrane protein
MVNKVGISLRSNKAILNFLASSFRNGIGLILGVVATPIILRYLGDEQFAIFRVLLDWFSHLALLEFGLYAAALSFLAKILGEKEHKLGVALQVMFRKYSHVLLGQVGSLIVFAFLYNYLVPVSDENQRQAWWSFVILSFSTVLIYSQIFRARLEASQRGYLVSYIMVAQNVLYLSLAVCFVYWSYGVIGQAIAYVTSLVFMLVLYLYFCREDLPLFFTKDILVMDDVALFKKQRKSLFYSELFGRMSLMSDNIIITFILGTSAVTPFFLTQRLAQIMQQQLQHVSNSTWPALGELYYKNQKDTLNKRILELTEIIAWLSGISLGALVISNKSFMYLWTGGSTYSGDITTILACVNGGLFAICSLWGWCFAAVNRTEKIVPIYFVQALVNVIGSFVFTYWIGLNGPLIGTFLGFGVVTVWWQGIVICEIFEIKYLTLMKKWIIPFVLPMIVVVILYRLFPPKQAETWLELILLYTEAFIVLGAVSTFTLISHTTRVLCYEKALHFLKAKWR